MARFWGFQRTAAAAGLLLLLLLPVLGGGEYLIYSVTLANIYLVLAVTWNLLAGYVGELNLGHAIFFGVGAYTAAILNTKAGISPWIDIPVGALVAVVFGLVVGIPCLRLRGPYLTTATFAFGIVLFLVASSLSTITGGEEGIRNIAAVTRSTAGNYYLSLGLAAVTIGVCAWITHSRLGLIFRAIRDQVSAAAAAGINVTRYKLIGYMISAFFAGLAGSYYAHFMGIVVPDVLSVATSFTIVSTVAVGGLASLSGPILGTYALHGIAYGADGVADYRMLIYSLALTLSLLFFPGGLRSLVSRLVATARRQTALPGNVTVSQGDEAK